MADTVLPVSPALGWLIRCLTGGSSVAFEIFSLELTPLLPASADPTLDALRQAVATTEDKAMRRALSVALGADARQRIRTATLVIDLHPIRDGLQTVGLLAVATATTGDTRQAERYTEMAGETIRRLLEADDTSQVQRHMEMAGEAIRQLLEAEVQRARAESECERLGAGWLQLIGHMPGLTGEAELFNVFLQALAIWHDLDTRVYARDVCQRFVLVASLPGSRDNGPVELPSEVVERQWPDRISSIAELERLGWNGPPYELTLVPLGPQNDVTHIVAIRGILDAKLELGVLTGCRILDVCLERAVAHEERRLEERLTQRLHEIGGVSAVTATLMQDFVDDLACWVGAEHGAFHASAPETPRAGPTGFAVEAGVRANRFLVPFSLLGSAHALEFSTSSAVPFTVRHQRLARAGTTLLKHWLLGLNQANQVLERDRQARSGGSGSDSRAT